jgi:CRISPR-associated endonuclease Csn1
MVLRQLQYSILMEECQMQKNYNIGLDIGTTSVGWAVVDPDTNNLLKRQGKSLWGVRLFEIADPAEKRRLQRGTRRRYDRRRKRIALLQEEFAPEINLVDANFFEKLKESFYREDDIENKKIKLNENDKEFLNKYYKYKTIYHLRDALINNPEKMDIRLVYLAIHHIIKYRGNFLLPGDNFDVDNLDIKSGLKKLFDDIFTACDEFELDPNYSNLIDYQNLEDALLTINKNDKKKMLKDELNNIISKNTLGELQKLFTGNKFEIAKMFNLESDQKIEVNFSDSTYEDKITDIENLVGDKTLILDELKEIYNMSILKVMFKGNENASLSSLMIKNYLTHQKHLIFLKKLFDTFPKENHRLLTSNEKKAYQCIYDLYVHNHMDNKTFVNEIKKSYELCKNKISQELTDEFQSYEYEMENGLFMPRITDTENGMYPYQLNKSELIKIIENQGKYYPFLLKKCSDNKTYRLVKLLEFKIPYYVGPLNTTTNIKNVSNQNAWLIKKDNDVKITPYNFDEVIDKEATAEKFILKMISRCTYLLDEYALPSNSILFCKYKVLNELKQIRINDEFLSNELINKIYNELFLKEVRPISEKIFIDYLKLTNELPMNNEFKITGYSSDKKFANNMKSYIDFFGPNGILSGTKYVEDDAENIIKWITIFEDKNILKTKINNEYPDLSEDRVNSILQKRYTGWGRLSKALLVDLKYFDKQENKNKSIIDLMETTNENFMQIINNKTYNFKKLINDYNTLNEKDSFSYDVVKKLATSPANKRGIYQAMKVINELTDILGKDGLKNVFIEMARGDEEKKRKDSRKDFLLKLYDKHKKEINNYKNLYRELQNTEEMTDKIFLYFIQEGKSLYSQKPLTFENLNTKDYQIDHILPQSLIKDNSIDNRALVLLQENQDKKGDLVVPDKFRTKENIAWWNSLKEKGLMSAKKYNRLLRDHYSDDAVKGFINRQLVETRQVCLHVANIIQSYYEKANVCYINADVSHNYRELFELYKYRDLNDYHHAHDAYLAATLGNYQTYTLNKNIKSSDIKTIGRLLFDNNEYKKLKYGYVVNSLNKEFLVIDKKTQEVLDDKIDSLNKTIANTLYQNDVYISKKTEIKTGALYKESIVSAKSKNSIKMPLKANLNPDLYGGYINVNPTYLKLIEYNGKYKIIGIPLILEKNDKYNHDSIDKYIRNQLNLKQDENYSIVKECIPFNTLFEFNNQKVYIVGYSIAHKNCELNNAEEQKISKKDILNYKYILNHVLNNKKINLSDEELIRQEKELVTIIIENSIKNYPLYDKELNMLKSTLDNNNFTEEELSTLIKQLIILLNTGKVNANFTSIENCKLGDRVGRLSGINVNHAKIITKSVTGIKEHYYEF